LTEAKLIVTDAPLSEVSIKRWRNGAVIEASDKVAEETPIALIYNGVSHAVMLATPQDLEDFALGFSLSEGILQHKSELYDIEIVEQAEGIELRMDVATECFVKLKEKRRNLVGRTGCGLCGAESLEQALRLPDYNNVKIDGLQPNIHAPSRASFEDIKATSIEAAFHAIQAKQVLQQATGATHACAWVSESGEVELVREDVGRHNAMDKLIGALAKVPPQQNGFVLTSSRASYEMVQKVAMAGLDVLVAISAPTGLAVRLAEAYDVTLVGFLREGQFVIYTHAERIKN
jgi:FdhD protein